MLGRVSAEAVSKHYSSVSLFLICAPQIIKLPSNPCGPGAPKSPGSPTMPGVPGKPSRPFKPDLPGKPFGPEIKYNY